MTMSEKFKMTKSQTYRDARGTRRRDVKIERIKSSEKPAASAGSEDTDAPRRRRRVSE